GESTEDAERRVLRRTAMGNTARGGEIPILPMSVTGKTGVLPPRRYAKFCRSPKWGQCRIRLMTPRRTLVLKFAEHQVRIRNQLLFCHLRNYEGRGAHRFRRKGCIIMIAISSSITVEMKNN